MMDKEQCVLASGGLRGAESAFGEAAERWGIKEVIFNFEGHILARERPGCVVLLSEEELLRGNISMELASKLMHRTYYEADKIRKVLQLIFHMVNNGHQVFVVGTILPDNTVKGGTGWAAELAKLFNRPLSVFDQAQEQWFSWRAGAWHADNPRIEHPTFVGTGTRNLTAAGLQAIESLFAASFI